MPAVSAIVVPQPGYVYVEGNFADVPGAVYGCVERVDTLTGDRFPLRPYISYSSDGCLLLSCGAGIWWDTEAPLDRAVYYCATVMDATGATITTAPAYLASATFTGVTASSLPACDTGQVWTNTGGAAADYSGTGTRAQHAVTSTGVNRVSSIPITTPNFVAQVTAFPAALALTQPTEQWMLARADAAGLNGYKARVRYNTGSTVDLILEKIVAGVPTTLATASAVISYAATTGVGIKFQPWGATLKAKIWDITTPEPDYQISVTDSSYLAVGTLDLVSLRNVGNTNGTVNMQWDNLIVADVCAVNPAVTACSTEVVVPSGGCFRLGDPVYPCHDQIVCLDGGGECAPDGGIFFARMDPETYADNSGQLLPVNARRPIGPSRNRRDASSTLVLVTATFADRDDVLALNEPGTPLLWRGPASYGIPDRYMSVGDVGVDRSFTDHQQQPRVITMPYQTEDAPVGPAQGVCGTRIADLCDLYPTWDAIVAAGLTYADLLRGKASTEVSVDPATWSEVNAAYASWTALNAGQTSWDDTWRGVP